MSEPEASVPAASAPESATVVESVHYQLLAQTEEIRRFVAGLQGVPAIALDTEADSLHSYREKTCLMQISTCQANTILDPLSGGDGVRSLYGLLADPGVGKVLHGGDYDIRLLKKDYGFAFRGVVDTAIAAQFLGLEQTGLAALLQAQFGLHLQKRFQRADWSQRPLSDEFLHYAALDTAYLLELWQHLREALLRLGRLAWAQEEFELLEAITPAPLHPPSCFDVKGAGKLRGRELAILQSLVELRDEESEKADRPPFKVLSNEALLLWAQNPPRSNVEVVEARGVNRRLVERLASRILDSVRKAEALPPDRWPQRAHSPFRPMTPQQRVRLDRLRQMREQTAEELGLAVGLLVNSETLERLCRAEPSESERVLASLKRWQQEVVGDRLAQAIRGL